MRADQTLPLGGIDDGDGDPVLWGLPGAVEELAFGEDVDAEGVGEGFEADEGGVAYGAFNSLSYVSFQWEGQGV